jgi:hypothetical protein
MVTDLDSFRRFQHIAPPMLHLTHYPELAESKGVVLMRGDVELSKLTQVEAKVVSSLMHTYYLQNDKYHMVSLFNKQPKEFNFEMRVADLKLMKAKRDKDDEVAERTEWVEDEYDRRKRYDAQAATGNREVGSTPWNPEIGEDGKLKEKTTRQKYSELWKDPKDVKES